MAETYYAPALWSVIHYRSAILLSEQKNIGARAPARNWTIYMSYETSQQMALSALRNLLTVRHCENRWTETLGEPHVARSEMTTQAGVVDKLTLRETGIL
jgi:hypothetical protein